MKNVDLVLVMICLFLTHAHGVMAAHELKK